MSEISTYEIDCIQDGEKPIQTPEHDEMQHAEAGARTKGEHKKQTDELTADKEDAGLYTHVWNRWGRQSQRARVEAPLYVTVGRG